MYYLADVFFYLHVYMHGDSFDCVGVYFLLFPELQLVLKKSLKAYKEVSDQCCMKVERVQVSVESLDRSHSTMLPSSVYDVILIRLAKSCEN